MRAVRIQQCNIDPVRGLIPTILRHPYGDFMSGIIAFGRRKPRHEPLSNSQVNLIPSSGHLMREFLIRLASTRFLSDERWQR